MNLPAYQSSTASATEPHPSRGLRFFAHFFSILFHPILISAYILSFLIYLHPSVFEGVDPHTKNLRMLSIILFTIFFPCF
ncbi:MAG TPA: hypothetical protein VNW49_05140, partial [Puia sp.]|nr:hypothetical protein [Puia sp.]